MSSESKVGVLGNLEIEMGTERLIRKAARRRLDKCIGIR